MRPLLFSLPAWLTALIAAPLVLQLVLQLEIPRKWRLIAAAAAVAVVVVVAFRYRHSSLPVHAYGVMLALAAVVAITIGLSRCYLAGFQKARMVDFALYLVLCGVVGARVFHVFEFHKLYFGGEYLEVADAPRGVRIARVAAGAVAGAPRLREGDVVLKIDGRSVASAREFAVLASSRPNGEAFELDVRRRGREQKVNAPLLRRPPGILAAIAVWNGGLVFYGGVMGSMCYVVWWAFRRMDGVSSLVRLFDVAAPSTMFGLAMGRVGCFLNGCCFGAAAGHGCAVAYPQGSPLWRGVSESLKGLEAGGWGEFLRPRGGPLWRGFFGPGLGEPGWREHLSLEGIDAAAMPHTLHVHPQQLYAALVTLAIGAFLSWVFYKTYRRAGTFDKLSAGVLSGSKGAGSDARSKRPRRGVVSALFLLIYPVARFVFEGWFRGDTRSVSRALPFTVSQYVSIVGFTAGIVWGALVLRAWRAERAAGMAPPAG